jgi:phage shock protein PspC (stress-responsive transcriptional regulator)
MPTELLARSRNDRMLAGVCGGLAKWLEFDPTALRIVFALGSLFSGIVPGMVVYFILAVIMPSEDSVQ